MLPINCHKVGLWLKSMFFSVTFICSCTLYIYSDSTHSMSLAAVEIGTYQGLSVDGRRADCKSGETETARTKR